jgi:hypothetical protein
LGGQCAFLRGLFEFSFQLSAFWESLLLPYRYLSQLMARLPNFYFKNPSLAFTYGFLTFSW